MPHRLCSSVVFVVFSCVPSLRARPGEYLYDGELSVRWNPNADPVEVERARTEIGAERGEVAVVKADFDPASPSKTSLAARLRTLGCELPGMPTHWIPSGTQVVVDAEVGRTGRTPDPLSDLVSDLRAQFPDLPPMFGEKPPGHDLPGF
jgi:hypothetical protein